MILLISIVKVNKQFKADISTYRVSRNSRIFNSNAKIYDQATTGRSRRLILIAKIFTIVNVTHLSCN